MEQIPFAIYDLQQEVEAGFMIGPSEWVIVYSARALLKNRKWLDEQTITRTRQLFITFENEPDIKSWDYLVDKYNDLIAHDLSLEISAY